MLETTLKPWYNMPEGEQWVQLKLAEGKNRAAQVTWIPLNRWNLPLSLLPPGFWLCELLKNSFFKPHLGVFWLLFFFWFFFCSRRHPKWYIISPSTVGCPKTHSHSWLSRCKLYSDGIHTNYCYAPNIFLSLQEHQPLSTCLCPKSVLSALWQPARNPQCQYNNILPFTTPKPLLPD